MKVLIISNLFPPYVMGGAEMAAHSLAKWLCRDGHICHVLTSAPTPNDVGMTRDDAGFTIERRYFPNIYQVYRANESSPVRKLIWHANDHYNLKSEAIVSEVIARFEPDIVNTHNLQGIGYNLVRAIGRARRPCVQVLHDFGLICVNMNRFQRGKECSGHHAQCRVSAHVKHRYYETIEHLAFWAPSSALLAQYEAFLPRYAVRLAIPLPLYFVHKSESIRRENQAERPLRILFTGQTTPWKGIDFVVEVLGELASRHSFSFDSVGGGAGLDALRARLKDVHWATVHGKVAPERVGAFMESADLMVVPSLWFENAPLVVSQAIQCGLPIFASDIGGLPELVRDGLNGRLLPAGDHSAWRAALEAVLRDASQLDAWRTGARELQTRFSPETLGRQVCDLFEDMRGRGAAAVGKTGYDDATTRA